MTWDEAFAKIDNIAKSSIRQELVDEARLLATNLSSYGEKPPISISVKPPRPNSEVPKDTIIFEGDEFIIDMFGLDFYNPDTDTYNFKVTISTKKK